MKARTALPFCLFLSGFILPGEVIAQYYNTNNITGRWTGYWYNSNGNSGRDVLRVCEYRNGKLTGVWGDGDDLYYIRGWQTAARRYFWEAFSEGYHYRAWADLSRDRQRLRVRYTVTHFDDGRWQRYGGWSDLWRRSSYDRRNYGYGNSSGRPYDGYPNRYSYDYGP